MSDFTTKVKTINSAVRTTLAVGICGIVGYGGWFGYDNYVKPSMEAKQAMSDLADLQSKFAETEEQLLVSKVALEKSEVENDRLETSMKFLKIEKRIANVTVLEKGKDEEGNPYMEVSFSEVDEEGNPVGPTRNYTIKGESLYVDAWVVSFKDKYVENANELRGTSLCVFKSIYGDDEKPSEGQSLDMDTADNGPPGVYKSDKKREFEQKIWSDFWKVSNNKGLQEELGISAIHGLAPYVKPIEGKTYQVHIRATGRMTLGAIEEP